MLCVCGQMVGAYDHGDDTHGFTTIQGECPNCGQKTVGRLTLFWDPPSLYQFTRVLTNIARRLRIWNESTRGGPEIT